MSTPELDLTLPQAKLMLQAVDQMAAEYKRLAGALLFELNKEAASGLISRDALRAASQLQQHTPEEYLAPLTGGAA